jgi:hypothetical protein
MNNQISGWRIYVFEPTVVGTWSNPEGDGDSGAETIGGVEGTRRARRESRGKGDRGADSMGGVEASRIARRGEGARSCAAEEEDVAGEACCPSFAAIWWRAVSMPSTMRGECAIQSMVAY